MTKIVDAPPQADRKLPQIYQTSGGKAEKEYKTLEEKIADCFLEPGPGRVIVLPDSFAYKGRLIIPETAKRTGTTGTVLKVGYGCSSMFANPGFPGKQKDTSAPDYITEFRSLRPGDRVAYGTWTGIQFNFDQRPAYRVLADSEIATLVVGEATKLLEVEA